MYTLYAVGIATMLLNDLVGSNALGAMCSQSEWNRFSKLFQQVPLRCPTPILSASELGLLGNAAEVTSIVICVLD